MPPGRWTALFFLDEATALAAGHRPCGYCRRGDYLDFAEAFVTSYSIETDSDKLPTESVRFTCMKSCVTYRVQRPDGGGRATFGGWDFSPPPGGGKWEAPQ